MQNKIFGFVLGALVLSAVPAIASAQAVDCNVTPEIPQCQPQIGIPSLLMQPWGLTGADTPVVASGATVSDERGFASICPWFYPQGCFDLTKTLFYRLSMGYTK